ncbi:MAG: diguanylate cyclase [Methylovulum miyakonense]|uniref:diguanylate cyclase domain-containing protein n=1 Tax=Methylovulum miyakonense TaxID=645578 RepID=UPI003BB4C4A5
MVADHLQGLICQPYMIKGQVATIGVSIGISLYPDDATEINQLIHKADQEMYQAKHGVQ